MFSVIHFKISYFKLILYYKHKVKLLSDLKHRNLGNFVVRIIVYIFEIEHVFPPLLNINNLSFIKDIFGPF